MPRAVRHRLTRTRGRLPALAGAVLAFSGPALAVSGCSGGRIVAPSLTRTARPAGFIVASYAPDGVALSVPRNWTITAEKSPMIAAFSSGPAVMSLWRYSEPGRPALTTTAQLHSALNALERAIRRAQPTVQIGATDVTNVGGAGAVIVDAQERVGGQIRQVRSEHVYVDGAELVMEAYAPPAQFAAIDHSVFSPVRRSLTLLNGGQPTRGQATTSTTATPTPQVRTRTTGGTA